MTGYHAMHSKQGYGYYADLTQDFSTDEGFLRFNHPSILFYLIILLYNHLSTERDTPLKRRFPLQK